MNMKVFKSKGAALPHIDINSGQLSMEPSYDRFLIGHALTNKSKLFAKTK